LRSTGVELASGVAHTVFSVQRPLYCIPQLLGGRGCMSNSGTLVFGMWCTATCRQTINAIVLTPYDLFFETNTTLFHFNIAHNHTATIFFLENSSLCACWFFFIMPYLSFLLLPSPCCRFLAGCWLLISSTSWGGGPSLGPPSPPFPNVTPIPSRPRQHPAFSWGTLASNRQNTASPKYRVGRSIVDCFLRTRRRRCWGLWAERLAKSARQRPKLLQKYSGGDERIRCRRGDRLPPRHHSELCAECQNIKIY
jgi:hypothetical protein